MTTTHAGSAKALKIFHRAAREIGAYRRFLAAHRVKASSIKGTADWDNVPVMDKKNYLYRYPPAELFPRGATPPMVYASSGSSGHPTFWFRGDRQETAGGAEHEIVFRDIFGIRKNEPTLVVICFSMGVWVAGNYTLACCRDVARRGYRLTTATPGIEMEDVMNILREVAPRFRNCVLAGYPPFLMDVVSEAKKRKIPVRRTTKFMTAGDKFSEPWRDALMDLAGGRDPYRSVISVYGSADAGVLGYETPLSIFVRREALRQPALSGAIFGDEAVQPALVQYDPKHIFFEERKRELLFTTDTATPLVRYNIHDIGKVMSREKMDELLREAGLSRKASAFGRWDLPFIIKGGRNDVAVTFYALNIYPENIKSALADRVVKRFASGQFFAFNRDVDHAKKQELCINVELAEGIRHTARTDIAIQQSIVRSLIAENIEYRKLYATLGKRALPKVRTFPYGSKRFYERGVRGLMSVSGKKAKMVGKST